MCVTHVACRCIVCGVICRRDFHAFRQTLVLVSCSQRRRRSLIIRHTLTSSRLCMGSDSAWLWCDCETVSETRSTGCCVRDLYGRREMPPPPPSNVCCQSHRMQWRFIYSDTYSAVTCVVVLNTCWVLTQLNLRRRHPLAASQNSCPVILVRNFKIRI